jgi:hypothetical protein
MNSGERNILELLITNENRSGYKYSFTVYCSCKQIEANMAIFS